MSYLKTLFTVAVLGLLPAVGQAQPARPPFQARAASAASPAFDATFYHLAIDLRFDPAYLYGRTRVEGRAVGEPLATLVLDFSTNMRVDSVRASGGGRLAFTHARDALAVTLPAPVAPGAAVAVDVFYQGVPAPSGFGTFAFGHNAGGAYAWTLSEPYGARAWWPSKDHPSDKADSVRVTVTVPEPLQVASNGLLVGETHAGGRATYDWFSRYPIASYLVSLAAGVYDVTEQRYVRPDSLAARYGPLDLPILHYAYRGSFVLPGWQRVVEAFPLFESWFGPYPFAAEKYGHAQFTWSGGMEHQTMTSMGTSHVGTVVHELAHQWYGDLVTTRYWPHLWLNEGFASYAELLYYQAYPELNPGLYERVFNLYYDGARRAQGTLVVEDTATVGNLFDGSRVYDKGAMVLHMLRGVAGDAAFRETLRRYAADPALRYGTATTADLQRVAEAASGLDLDTFFRQWVTEGTGYPVYAVRWGYVPAEGGARVAVTVEQTQTGRVSTVPVFAMPLVVQVETDRGAQRFTVRNDQRVQTYTFDVAGTPAGVTLDPERWVLRNTPVTATSGEAVPEPVARTGVVALYPNPSDGVVHVELGVARGGPVRLALYDARGRRVRTVVEGPLGAGRHGFTVDLGGLPAGTYFLHLAAGGPSQVTPLVRLSR